MPRGIISALCLLFVITMGCKAQPIELHVSYTQLSGVAKGDRVLLNNNAAGSVTGIQYNDDQTFTVDLAVDRGFARALTEHARFYVIDDPGADGHKAIAIRVSQPGGLPLKSGALVPGSKVQEDLTEHLQKEIQGVIRFFKETLEQMGSDVRQVPETEAYQQIKKSLEALAAAIRQKEKQARENIKRQWLPRIQRELDDLRRRLEAYGREDELKPLEVELDRIRRI
jgi:paraquat-inducible protein B